MNSTIGSRRRRFFGGAHTLCSLVVALGFVPAVLAALEPGPAPDVPGRTLTLEPPRILVPPTPVMLSTGARATLAVQAAGSEPLDYQWFRDGSPIPDASGPTLELAGATEEMAGAYTVEIRNAAGKAASQPATVRLRVLPRFVRHPVSRTVAEGSVVTFAAPAAGSGPLRFQWRKDGVALAGATSSSLTLQNVRDSDAGRYAVTVANELGTTSWLSALRGAALAVPGPAPFAPITLNGRLRLTATELQVNVRSNSLRGSGLAELQIPGFVSGPALLEGTYFLDPVPNSLTVRGKVTLRSVLGTNLIATVQLADSTLSIFGDLTLPAGTGGPALALVNVRLNLGFDAQGAPVLEVQGTRLDNGQAVTGTLAGDGSLRSGAAPATPAYVRQRPALFAAMQTLVAAYSTRHCDEAGIVRNTFRTAPGGSVQALSRASAYQALNDLLEIMATAMQLGLDPQLDSRLPNEFVRQLADHVERLDTAALDSAQATAISSASPTPPCSPATPTSSTGLRAPRATSPPNNRAASRPGPSTSPKPVAIRASAAPRSSPGSSSSRWIPTSPATKRTCSRFSAPWNSTAPSPPTPVAPASPFRRTRPINSSPAPARPCSASTVSAGTAPS